MSAVASEPPVAHAPGQRQQLLGRGASGGILAHAEEEIRSRPMDGHQRLGGNAVAQSPGDGERLVVEGERLPDAERGGGLLRRLEEVVQRLVPHLRAGEVMGQHLVVLGDALGVDLLDGEPDQPVQLPPSLDEERRVGHVVGQGVGEQVDHLREQRLLPDQLDGGQLAQHGVEVSADLGEPPEQAAGELAPDDRGHLERALGLVGQAVDARGDDVLDGVGDVDPVDGGGEHEPPVRRLDRARLAERADHLLDEERIALRLPGDQLGRAPGASRMT